MQTQTQSQTMMTTGRPTFIDFASMFSNNGPPADPGTYGYQPPSISRGYGLGQSSGSELSGSANGMLYRDGQGSRGEKKGHKGSRARTGCITCRLRKKRCDEGKPDCQTCSRLGIQCMGYGKKRPEWLKDEGNLKLMRDEIREKVLAQRTNRPKKPRTDSSERSGSAEADMGLQLDQGLEQDAVFEDMGWPAIGQLAGSTSHQGGAASFPPADQVQASPTWLIGAEHARNGIVPINGIGGMPSLPAGMQPQPPGINPASILPVDPLVAVGLPASHAESYVTTNPLRTSLNTSTIPYVFTGLTPRPTSPPTDDPEVDRMWKTFFAQTPSAQPSPTVLSPDPFPTLPQLDVLDIPGTSTNFAYLHHYLNVVMPLQFRTAKSAAIGEIVVPLAFQRAEILTSISSLSALHIASKRLGLLSSGGGSEHDQVSPNSLLPFPLDTPVGTDAMVARTAHQASVERLRSVSSENLAAEDVIFPALFAVSFCLFMGGTSAQWREVIAMCQKCLFAALAASPDLTGEYSAFTQTTPGRQTPWQRYRPLIEVMITTDIIGSLSMNRGSRLLPTYRTLLNRMGGTGAPEQAIPMLEVMGCDNTTLLAIAETTALSEWRDKAEETGSLSHRSLVHRAEAIEKLLEERMWRKTASIVDLDGPGAVGGAGGKGIGPDGEPDERTKTHLMAEVFYHAAKVYLATVVNGPFPRVPEIAQAVKETIKALKEIAKRYTRPDIYRKLVFPITITGCHCDTADQQSFFRFCFERLGKEAAGFGNTRSALRLMEEVWARRAKGPYGSGMGRREGVCWRVVMGELEGWEGGLLMI